MGGNMVGQIKNVQHLLSYCYLLIWFENCVLLHIE